MDDKPDLLRGGEVVRRSAAVVPGLFFFSLCDAATQKPQFMFDGWALGNHSFLFQPLFSVACICLVDRLLQVFIDFFSFLFFPSTQPLF